MYSSILHFSSPRHEMEHATTALQHRGLVTDKSAQIQHDHKSPRGTTDALKYDLEQE